MTTNDIRLAVGSLGDRYEVAITNGRDRWVQVRDGFTSRLQAKVWALELANDLNLSANTVLEHSRTTEKPAETLRDALGELGGIERIHVDVPEAWERDLDRPVRVSLATASAQGGDQPGRLYISCSGWAVLRIDWLTETGRVANRRPAYVVVDEQAQQLWKVRADRLRDEGKSVSQVVAELGRCPSERLKLVQSG